MLIPSAALSDAMLKKPIVRAVEERGHEPKGKKEERTE